jgi:hypothetical protein
MPGSTRSSSRASDISACNFVRRPAASLGRAVLYPVYQGTYERFLPLPDTELKRREEYVQWSQDVHRSIDYLATRRDLDLSHLAYYGESMGSRASPIMVAIESRFHVAVLLRPPALRSRS